MVERKFARGQRRAAILASIAIAQQDIFPRKRPRLVWNASIFK
jgi:hypothetical protein